MSLRDDLLAHAEVGDDPVTPAGQAAGHRPGLDAPGLVRDPEEPGPPVTEHSRSTSAANRSKSVVNWLPGSAQGARTCFTPCVGHCTRGTSATIEVVN